MTRQNRLGELYPQYRRSWNRQRCLRSSTSEGPTQNPFVEPEPWRWVLQAGCRLRQSCRSRTARKWLSTPNAPADMHWYKDITLPYSRKKTLTRVKKTLAQGPTVRFYRETLCVRVVFAVARCLSIRPSVRLSVCPSVTLCIVSTRLKISWNFLFGPVAPSL